MRRRIFLLRHAEVAYFTEDGTPVRPASVPLTENGRRQAEAARHALAHEPIDRIVTSGLPRTRETAEIVRGQRTLPIEEHPEFQEIRPGHIRSIPREKIEAEFLGAFKVNDPRKVQFLGGESFGELTDRINPAWERLMAEGAWERMLLVAHGAVNRVILAKCLGTGPEVYSQLEQDPACINVIDVPRPGSNGPRARTIVRAINVTPYNLVKEGLEETTMESLWRAFQGNGEGKNP